MKEQLRLDKYLADMGVGTRTEIKNYAKKGRITVNGQLCKSADQKIHISEDEVFLDGEKVSYHCFEYYMLNKPKGVVSATSDPFCKTVIDLIKGGKSGVRNDLSPVGRLDKDTEGLLLITNDGDLSHRLLSPKKHVGKVYYAKIKGVVTKEDVEAFSLGVVLEEFTALPANLSILSISAIDKTSEIEVTIYEGKFHQVKKMFQAIGKEVIYLKRLSMGNLTLDLNLKPGEFRSLTTQEKKDLSLL